MLWFKKTIVMELENITSKPSKMRKNINYNPNNYQLKDLIKYL